MVDLPPLEELLGVLIDVGRVETLAGGGECEVDVALRHQAGDEVVGSQRLDLVEVVDPPWVEVAHRK